MQSDETPDETPDEKPDEKPDLLRDLQRSCRKLEEAIRECERLLEASPMGVMISDELLAAALRDKAAHDEPGASKKPRR